MSVDGLVSRAPPRVRPAAELLVAAVRDTAHDRVPGLAAEVAFYLILSLPPLLLTLLGTVGYLSATTAIRLEAQLLNVARTALAPDTIQEVLVPVLNATLSDGRADIASVGFVVALWTGSRAFHTLTGAITIAYDLDARRRAGWLRRLLALLVTAGGIAASIAIAFLLLSGPELGERLARPLGLATAFATVWRLAYWPVVAAVATGLLTTLYHVAAPWSTPWRRDVPGALVALALWLAGSASLRVYVAATIESTEVYARLAAPLVVLLWLWVTAFAVLFGAELNAEIERRWPTVEHTK